MITTHQPNMIPILPSLDTVRSVEFCNRVFGTNCTDSGDYVIIKNGTFEVHYYKCDDPKLPTLTSCYISVKDIDALYAEIEPTGSLHPNGKIADREWGVREFVVVDPDGNIFRIGQSLKELQN
jgi:predicted enzyme related to lactoylglutathione lyase